MEIRNDRYFDTNINTPELPNTTLLLNNMDRIGISKPLAFTQYQNFNKTQFKLPAKQQ